MKPRTKKSETLQVRLPHGMKRDFMQRCEVEGRAASDVIRDFLESYLTRPVEILTSEKAVMIRRTFVYPTLAAAALFGAVITLMPGTSQASSLRQDFDAMDANKDGFVSAQEYKTPPDGVTYSMSRTSTVSTPSAAAEAPVTRTEKKTIVTTGQTLEKTISRLDMDGDQRLSFEEYRIMRLGAAQAIFKRGDVNGDGSLSQAEYVEGVSIPAGAVAQIRAKGPNPQLEDAIRQGREKAASRFKVLDTNRNGALTLEELTPS